MEYITDTEKLYAELENIPIDPEKPVSRNADENTVKLFGYLKSIYGKKFISGQQYLRSDEPEDDVYFAETGELPAIRGYDLMDMDKEHGDDQVNRAIKWAKDTGCIITMCWHWYAPDDLDDMNGCCWSFYYKTTSYDHKTSFDLLKAVEYGTPEYGFAVSRIDRAAAELRRFEKEGIPVLFRPLHEANGNWFWWGVRKDDDRERCIAAYKKLWYMIFDRIENFHKLTNIIWVWNGQDKDMLVHPNTFDIAGDDIYSEKENDHSSQSQRFEYISGLSHGKMVTLSECGYIPSPAEMRKDSVKWLWWLPWWGLFVHAVDGWKPLRDESGRVLKNEKYMKGSFLKDTFADEDVITLSRLPFFKGDETLPEKFRKTEK